MHYLVDLLRVFEENRLFLLVMIFMILVPRVKLGNTNIQVPQLGLGTVKLGRNQGVKYPKAFALPEDDQVLALLETAQNIGVDLIDTAPAYGESETRLGKHLYCVAPRSNWILMTKVGEEFEQGQSFHNFSPTHIKKSIHRSLNRLKTDYLDIVLVHSDGRDQEIIENNEVFETLAQLKQEGLILAYGMSTKTIEGGLMTLKYAEVLMMTYHQNYPDEKILIDQARVQNKGLFVKKALGSGHLADSKAALSFVLKESGVASVVVGTLNPNHLRENANLACGIHLRPNLENSAEIR